MRNSEQAIIDIGHAVADRLVQERYPAKFIRDLKVERWEVNNARYSYDGITFRIDDRFRTPGTCVMCFVDQNEAGLYAFFWVVGEFIKHNRNSQIIEWLEKDGFKILTSPYKADGTYDKDEALRIHESNGGLFMRWSIGSLASMVLSNAFSGQASFHYGYNPPQPYLDFIKSIQRTGDACEAFSDYASKAGRLDEEKLADMFGKQKEGWIAHALAFIEKRGLTGADAIAHFSDASKAQLTNITSYKMTKGFAKLYGVKGS